jgi:hypothetical protein
VVAPSEKCTCSLCFLFDIVSLIMSNAENVGETFSSFFYIFTKVPHEITKRTWIDDLKVAHSMFYPQSVNELSYIH